MARIVIPTGFISDVLMVFFFFKKHVFGVRIKYQTKERPGGYSKMVMSVDTGTCI